MRQATGPEAQDDILHYPLKEPEKYGRPLEGQTEEFKSCMACREMNITDCPKRCNPNLDGSGARQKRHRLLYIGVGTAKLDGSERQVVFAFRRKRSSKAVCRRWRTSSGRGTGSELQKI